MNPSLPFLEEPREELDKGGPWISLGHKEQTLKEQQLQQGPFPLEASLYQVLWSLPSSPACLKRT